MPTDVGYTGQRADASTGLMYYGARYYDSYLNRFISADSIVPGAGNPQALNRYSYVMGNPLKYTDPSGHCIREEQDARDECFRYMNELKDLYGLRFTDDWDYWTAGQMGELKNVMQTVRDYIGGIENFRSIWAGTKIRRQEQDGPGECKTSDACAPGRVKCAPKAGQVGGRVKGDRYPACCAYHCASNSRGDRSPSAEWIRLRLYTASMN
ncbi:MAG: RHS repeat-associated core domain-containing protein [Chloroflexi bacterium]|nr:RHS repeat-associated core domain-containing protein [Chloroflexota bacterium]